MELQGKSSEGKGMKVRLLRTSGSLQYGDSGLRKLQILGVRDRERY